MSFDSLRRVPESPSSEANMGGCHSQVDPAENSDDDIYCPPTGEDQANFGQTIQYKCGDVISRNAYAYSKWQEVLVLAVIISLFLGVFMVTLDSTKIGVWILVYLCDALFIVDMVLMFFTTYKGKGGIQVYKRNKIIRKYLRNQFSVDLLSVLPIEVFAFLLDKDTLWMNIALFRLNRLLRVYKIFAYFDNREDDLDRSTALTRGLKYFVISLMTTHLISCGWFAIACDGLHEGVNRTCKEESWAKSFDLGFEITEVEASKAYTTSLYWAVATVTSTGYGDIYAQTIPEKWFSVFGMMAGIGVFFGMLLGGMTSLLTNLDAHRSSYVHRFQTIQMNLKDQLVSPHLRSMVLSYYEYLWRNKRGVVPHGVYDRLPVVFQAEIAQATNSETILKAPVFRGVDPGVVRMLSLSFKHSLCLPNQIIIKRGDIGSQMFFIHHGEVEIMDENNDGVPRATLTTGKMFGEISLLFNLPRTSTVRAKTHCDLMILEKSDLHRILKHYPKAAAKLQEEAKKRLEKINKISAPKAEKKTFDETNINQPKWLRRSSFMPSEPLLKAAPKVQKTPSNLSESLEPKDSEEGVQTQGNKEQKESHGDLSQKRCCGMCPNAVLLTTSISYRVWEYLITIVIILNGILHPYLASFTAYERRSGFRETTAGEALLAVTYLFDVMYIMDIAIKFRSHDPGSPADLKSIAKAYVKDLSFWIDLIAVLPLEVFAFAAGGSTTGKWRLFAILRLNRLLKMYDVLSFFNHLEASLHVTISLVRSVRLILYIILLSHWAACLVFIMACYGQECDSRSWIVERKGSVNINTPRSEYITSIYWAVATMTSTGYGDINANTTVGRVVAVIMMLVGLLLYGYSLSLMAATLANADSPRVRFQEKLFAVRDYMKEQHLKQGLQQQVITYMNLLWTKYQGIWMPGEEPMMQDVPNILQEDISYDTTAACLEKVPLFAGTDDSFQRTLSLSKTTYLFSPGDVIIYAGDVGREMYLIRQGWCQVVTPDESSMLGIIGPGGYVGEAGLVFPENRSTTVKAKTHCVLDMIDINNLHDTLSEFQMFREQFAEAEKTKSVLIELQKNNSAELNTQAMALKKSGVLEPSTDENDSSVNSLKTFQKTIAGNTPNKDYLAPFQSLGFFAKIFANMLMKRTFHPEGKILKGFTTLMVLVSVINSFTVALQAAFLHDSYIMWLISYLLDVVMVISLYLSFHVAFYDENNILVVHPLSTARYYLRTNFLLDFLAIFPFEIFAFAYHPQLDYNGLYLFSLVRLTKLLQLYRLPMAFTYFESSIEKETGLLREIKFGFYSVIFFNWLTCAFFMMACPPNLSDSTNNFVILPNSGHHCLADSWLLRAVDNSVAASTSSLYTACLYWASATSVSVGYGDISAFKEEEMVISLIAMVAGVLFFGYIIASVAASLANADAQRARFQEKLSSVTHFLKSEKIESSLQQRIFHYYDYVWLRTRGVDPNSLFNFLPLSLWGDVTLDLYEETLKGISLFKDADRSFLKMLSRTIRPILFLKGEYVVRKFDMGQEMYFIKRGAVEVVSEDGAIVFATMRAGDSFGEVALLFSVPRTASIRAGTNADLFYLTKTDLDNVLDLYPKVKQTVLQIGEERRQQARQRSQAKAQAQKKSKSLAKMSAALLSASSAASSQKGLAEGPAGGPAGVETLQVVHPITVASRDAVGLIPSVVIEGEEYAATEVEDYEPPEDPIDALHEEEWEAGLNESLSDDEDNANASNNAQLGPQGHNGGVLSVEADGLHVRLDETEVGINMVNLNQNNVDQGNQNSCNNKGAETDAEEAKKSEKCRMLKRLLAVNRFTINPRSKSLHAFKSWMCFLGFISVWCITYQAGYQDMNIVLIVLGFIFDVFFLVEIYINFHTSFFDEYGDLTENFDCVYKNYLKSANGFSVDMIAALPLDIFALAAPSGQKLMVLFFLRLIHCVRLLRVSTYFTKWEKGLNINMLAARLTKFFVGLVLLIHFLSAIWYTIACPLAECKAMSWVELKVDIVGSALSSYCVCVYWTVATMTSTGYGDVYATTDIEMLFASVVMVAGKLMFGFILGNIASTLSNEEIPKVQYMEQLDFLKMTMKDQSVPQDIRHIVIDYMVNLWFHNKGIDSQELFTDTPPCLVAELFRKMSAPMFNTISLLKHCDEAFLRALSICVRHQVFIPGNYIMRKGDVGQEVYYIHKGEVQVWSEGEPLQVLKSGEVFGEVSLLSPVSRQVDVSARTHVVLLVLTLADFDRILMDFPTLAEHIHHHGYERFKDILHPDYAINKPYFQEEDDME